MKTTENITVTNGRLKKALNNQITPIIMPKVSKQVNQAVKNTKIQIAIMTKFYPHLDKCEVTLNNEKVLCKILHRFGGDLIDFYTPTGDEDYCTTLKEPCIIPRGEIECLVLDINDNTDEQIMIGYFINDEFIGLNPAKQGNLKLVYLGGTNQYWVKFGEDGLDIRTSLAPVTNIGEMDDEMEEITNVSADDVYTKAEVDQLLEDLKKEIIGDDTE